MYVTKYLQDLLIRIRQEEKAVECSYVKLLTVNNLNKIYQIYLFLIIKLNYD